MVLSETLDDIVDGDVETLATTFVFTEGPVWHPAGYLLFSDIPGDKIYKWRPADGVSIFRDPSGKSNGLTLDSQNRLIAVEHLDQFDPADGRLAEFHARVAEAFVHEAGYVQAHGVV